MYGEHALVFIGVDRWQIISLGELCVLCETQLISSPWTFATWCENISDAAPWRPTWRQDCALFANEYGLNSNLNQSEVIHSVDIVVRNNIKEKLQQMSSICAVFIHGSAVKGSLRPDSDVDLAILPLSGERITADERMAMAGELAMLVGREVDLGILSTNNLVYAKEVIEHGELLFTKNTFFSECFVSTCLSMYADLQQDRKEVLYAYSA